MKKQIFLYLKNKIIILFIIFLSITSYLGFKVIELYKNTNISYSYIKNLRINLKFNKLERVAHAGGGYNNKTYTNSIEALNLNKKNYNYFEIDFYINKDNELICSHNPEDQFIKKEILLKKYNYTPCTLITLNDWLDDNPEKVIITDVKNNNYKALKIIRDNIINFNTKFIPQIYHPKEYESIKKLGFTNIILTLYRLNENENDLNYILDAINNKELYAITMSENFVLKGYGNKIKLQSIPTYAHTINTKKRFFFYKYFLGIDNIYTDWLN